MAKKIFKAVGGLAFGLPGLGAAGIVSSILKHKKKPASLPPPVVGANESPAAVTARQEEEKRRRTAMAARSVSPPLTGSVVSPGSTLGGY